MASSDSATFDPEAMMRLALQQARSAAARGEVPVGALVWRDGAVLGLGHNVTAGDDDPAGHAEVVALRDAARTVGDWRLEGTTLVVTLEPCPMCLGAALLARVERLVYGAPDIRWGACGSVVDLLDGGLDSHLREVTGGVLANECGELLRRFFRELRG